MAATLDRLESERAFHDRQAAERAATFAADPTRLRVDEAAYLDHETWLRPALARLGPVGPDTRVLDYGCGHGMMATLLAKRGAAVTAFDLSPGYVAEARRRAEANGVRVNAVVADAEELPFADASFDAVWGHAVLHHLDAARAGRELRRVLAPGGVAVFCEPWGGHPLVRLARRFLPYPGKGHTADERPLDAGDVAALRAVFPGLTLEGFQLFGALRRVCRVPWLTRPLDALDRAVLGAGLGRGACRYVVLTLRQ